MSEETQYLIGKLEEALAVDGRVNALDIRITIAHGRVHLTGEVTTEERRAAILTVAQEVLPQLDVRNEITVLELAEAGKPEALDD
ncbi:MAG TPA: BON domain-containing protein [Candidatus Limnocylindrales bacterium]|nr:BON domain-containing protein [Candidatus Limnocylindrales bacterium]